MEGCPLSSCFPGLLSQEATQVLSSLEQLLQLPVQQDREPEPKISTKFQEQMAMLKAKHRFHQEMELAATKGQQQAVIKKYLVRHHPLNNGGSLEATRFCQWVTQQKGKHDYLVHW